MGTTAATSQMSRDRQASMFLAVLDRRTLRLCAVNGKQMSARSRNEAAVGRVRSVGGGQTGGLHAALETDGARMVVAEQMILQRQWPPPDCHCENVIDVPHSSCWPNDALGAWRRGDELWPLAATIVIRLCSSYHKYDSQHLRRNVRGLYSASKKAYGGTNHTIIK